MNTLIEKTLILAHRGASGHAPENTMEAFRLAAEMGADGVELDVHMTADGKVVVCHDSTLDRTTNAQGKISEYTLEELRAIDFGYHFYGKKRTGVKISTLDEVFEFAAPLGMIVNVEMKSGKATTSEIVHACYEIAERHGMKDRVIYSSFDHFIIREMKEQYPDTFVAPLYNFNMINPWSYSLDMGAKAVHPGLAQLRLDPNYVKNCHERGLRVHVWTANAEEDIQFLLDAGVDAIITNYPDVALNLRK